MGYHELLVHSRLHNVCHATETPEQVALAMEAYYQRGLAIAQDPRIVQIIYFLNHGPSAGMSCPPAGQPWRSHRALRMRGAFGEAAGITTTQAVVCCAKC